MSESLPTSGALQLQQIEQIMMQALRIAFAVALIMLVVDSVRIAYHLIRKLFLGPKLPGVTTESQSN